MSFNVVYTNGHYFSLSRNAKIPLLGVWRHEHSSLPCSVSTCHVTMTSDLNQHNSPQQHFAHNVQGKFVYIRRRGKPRPSSAKMHVLWGGVGLPFLCKLGNKKCTSFSHLPQQLRLHRIETCGQKRKWRSISTEKKYAQTCPYDGLNSIVIPLIVKLMPDDLCVYIQVMLHPEHFSSKHCTYCEAHLDAWKQRRERFRHGPRKYKISGHFRKQTWKTCIWIVMIVCAMPAFRIIVRRPKNIQYCTWCLCCETVHVASCSWVKYQWFARSSKHSICFHLRQLHPRWLDCQH